MPLSELIAKQRKKYELTKNIYCPFMKEVVYFNNKGFFHATHNGRGRIRNEADARMRLYLISDVNNVIKYARKYGNPPRLVPKNDPENKQGKEITYYELTHRFSAKKEVSVILRRIGRGRLHYYSVMFTRKQNRP